MNKEDKIYVAGHRGMVGSAIVRKLMADGFSNIITRTSAELDLRNQQAVSDFFALEKPDHVFLAAAKVGGIVANNTYRAEFIYDNLIMESNIIHHSYLNGVKKLLFLGSSCIYPKMAPQPLKEEYLLSGYLEETNQPYAIAKIAGIDDIVPFMEKVYPIKEEKRQLIPAVTHADGTGRLQTVDAAISPRYHALIQCFFQHTGIPILLNTSFNENEPIVNKPEEALDCFLRTSMDMLVMENIIVER